MRGVGPGPLAADLAADFAGRLSRVLLLVAAVALSVGALVAGVGIGQTTSSQLGDEIAALIPTSVSVSAAAVQTDGSQEDQLFPESAVASVTDMPHVVCAGMRVDIDAPVSRFEGSDALDVSVFGATEGYLCAAGVEDADGRNQLDTDPGLPVVYLGSSAAAELGVPPGPQLGDVLVRVMGQQFAVAGTIPDDPRFERAVVLPYAWVVEALGSDQQSTLTARTTPGAAADVADVIRPVVSPTEPVDYQVTRVNDLAEVRQGIDSQLGRLVAAVGAVLTLVTGLLLASNMIAAVASRTAEIGLRRSLGFSRAEVRRLFLCEGAVIGVLGGLTGSAVGLALVTGASILNGWQPVYQPSTYLLGLIVGPLVCTAAALILDPPSRFLERIERCSWLA